jgi:hypothetical protein
MSSPHGCFENVVSRITKRQKATLSPRKCTVIRISPRKNAYIRTMRLQTLHDKPANRISAVVMDMNTYKHNELPPNHIVLNRENRNEVIKRNSLL